MRKSNPAVETILAWLRRVKLSNLFHLYFILRYDHQERLSAKEAMAHAYFAPVREAAVRGGSQGANSGYAV